MYYRSSRSKAAPEFFWYDYETFGLSGSRDRPVQFAGVRTDSELRTIGPEIKLVCRPSLDYLPSVNSCLTHRTTPQTACERGMSEYRFARAIQTLLSEPNTCSIGYNSMRFDSKFTQFLFYRNLIDPYKWQWFDGNSRGDVIDLVRGVHVFGGRGLSWMNNEKGKVSFSLADMAAANHIVQWAPHEALSDVENTLQLAKLVREHNPELFAEYVDLRRKSKVLAETEDVFVSVVSTQDGPSPGKVLAHVAYSAGARDIYAVDLSCDPREIFPPERPHAEPSHSAWSRALHHLRPNKTPFVRRIDISGRMSQRDLDTVRRLGLNLQALQRNHNLLRTELDLGELTVQFFREKWAKDDPEDVDEALYGEFIPDSDRHKLDSILASTDEPSADWDQVFFIDERLPELVWRFRARNFPESLTREETWRWHRHCREKLYSTRDPETGLTEAQRFKQEIAEARKQENSPEALEILDALESYEKEVKQKLREEYWSADTGTYDHWDFL